MAERDRHQQTFIENVLMLLEEKFPWLGKENDDQVSGADTVDELADMHRSLVNQSTSGSHNSQDITTPRGCTRRNRPMASLKAEALLREFNYNGTRIPDPAPQMTVEQVRDLMTPTYPEIATATLTGPEDTGTALRYTFSRAIGSKG